MAAAIQLEEETRLLNVRTTGRHIHIQNTSVDRAKHLLSLTHSATLGHALRANAFSCCGGLRRALLSPSRLYPVLFMLMGAWVVFVIRELAVFDRSLDDKIDSAGFFDGNVGCIVPDFFIQGKESIATRLELLLDCRKNNFVNLMWALLLIVATLAFLWDCLAINTIKCIRSSGLRPLCFLLVPTEVIPDAMNDIVEIDVQNEQQLRAIGVVDDTAFLLAARQQQVHTFSLNIYDVNFHRRYFAPWTAYLFFGAFVPYALAIFLVVSQSNPGEDDWRTMVFAMWVRRAGLFIIAVRGVAETFRFLVWIKRCMCG